MTPDRSVRLVAVPSASAWDTLVDRGGGAFFHRYAFLSVVTTGLGLTLRPRAAVRDGVLIGAVPIVLKRLGPVRTVNWLPFPYVGPLVPAADLDATLAALIRAERRLRCVRSQHVLLGEDPRPHPGYTSSVDRTFVMPLTGRSDEEIFRGMAKDRRYALRRAERGGLRVRESTRREIAAVLPRLMAEPFRRQNLPAPYPADCLAGVWDALHENPDVLFRTAEIAGELAGVQISMAGGPRGLAWVIGRTPDQAGSDAMTALFWHTARWMRDRGCAELDLVGAPTEGIATFKRRLGGQERHYTVLRRQSRAHRAALRWAARRSDVTLE